MDVDMWSITWQTTVAGTISFQLCPGSQGMYVHMYTYMYLCKLYFTYYNNNMHLAA